jgi:hypothetical protein
MTNKQVHDSSEHWRELDGLYIESTGGVYDVNTNDWISLVDAHTGKHVRTSVRLSDRGRANCAELVRRFEERQEGEHHHHHHLRDAILEVLLRVSTVELYKTLPFTDVRAHLTPVADELVKVVT